MATRSQQFRAEQQRAAHPPREKKPRKPRHGFVVDTSQPGVSATDQKVGGGHSGARNLSNRAAKKGGAAMEDSVGQPSRKSTRRSTGRLKRSTEQQKRAIARATSPASHAVKAQAARGHSPR